MNIAMEAIKYEYVHKNIDKHLLCSHCHRPLINPVSANCNPKSHTFCRDCIENYINTNRSCPVCHQKLHNQDLTLITVSNFIDMLNDLLVKCLTCEQNGLKRMDLIAHHETCPKVNVRCSSSDGECSWKGTRDQLDKHLNKCYIKLLKPFYDKCQSYTQELENIIDQLQTENYKLNNSNKQLIYRAHKSQMSIVEPSKISPFRDKLDHQQTQGREPAKVGRQLNEYVVLKDFLKLCEKFDQQRIETDANDKQMNDNLNELKFQIAALQVKNEKPESQLKQPVKLVGETGQDSYGSPHGYRTYGNDNDGRTNNSFNYITPNNSWNIPGSGQPLPQNYVNGNSYANINNNASGNVARNALNHPGMGPFNIPISISISINTNIADGNANTNASRSINNITGGNNTRICAGNINIGFGSQNNVAGGNNNRIAGRNNHDDSHGNNTPAAVINNNGNINGGGGGNNVDINNVGDTVNNRDTRDNNGIINNNGGIVNGTGTNNRAGNNITGHDYNITGGSDSIIVSGNINWGGNSNNIAGGNDNYIADNPNNITHNNNNNNSNNNNNNNNNNNTLQHAAAEDDELENDTLGSHPSDDHGSETSSINGRFRPYRVEVHPPDVNYNLND